MPRPLTAIEDLDDGGFIARSGKPLPQSSDPIAAAPPPFPGNRNRKRNQGVASIVAPPRCQPSAADGGRRFDVPRPESIANSAVEGEDSTALNDHDNRMVTLTGTIRRGHRHDQIVEVHFEVPEKELNRMKARTTTKNEQGSTCSFGRGPHILLFTLLFAPFAFLASVFTTFYVGTMCWYNVYLYVSEELTVCHKIFLCPLLLIVYPVLITASTICLSVVSAVRQLSWSMSNWCREIHDYDKGFFVWLCDRLNVPQCTPYEVVILDEALLVPDGVVPERRSETSDQEQQTDL